MRRPRAAVAIAGAVALAAVLVVAAAALRSRPEPERAPRPPALGFPSLAVGVVANALDVGPAQETGRVQQLGAGWMREELRWSETEPRKGVFSSTRFDRLMVATARRGIRVLPLLIKTPAWAARGPSRLPPDLGRWQHFVRHVVRRYAPGGGFWRTHPELDGRLAPQVWEIWNEPYYKEFARPAADPAAYAALVKATVQAGRATAPSARFLVAAETVYQAADGSRRDWLRDFFAAVPGIGAYVDALAVHPYSLGSPRSTTLPRDNQFRRIDDLERTLTDLGVGPRPLWITELGWSTCTSRPPCSTPAQQRQDYTQALRLIAGVYRHRVKAVFAYRLGDLGYGPAEFLAGFGLSALDGRHKPAWAVVHAAALASR